MDDDNGVGPLDLDLAAVRAGLRAMLAAIDRGEVESTRAQAAYLAGACDALDMIALATPHSTAAPAAGRHHTGDGKVYFEDLH